MSNEGCLELWDDFSSRRVVIGRPAGRGIHDLIWKSGEVLNLLLDELFKIGDALLQESVVHLFREKAHLLEVWRQVYGVCPDRLLFIM